MYMLSYSLLCNVKFLYKTVFTFSLVQVYVQALNKDIWDFKQPLASFIYYDVKIRLIPNYNLHVMLMRLSLSSPKDFLLNSYNQKRRLRDWVRFYPPTSHWSCDIKIGKLTNSKTEPEYTHELIAEIYKRSTHRLRDWAWVPLGTHCCSVCRGPTRSAPRTAPSGLSCSRPQI